MPSSFAETFAQFATAHNLDSSLSLPDALEARADHLEQFLSVIFDEKIAQVLREEIELLRSLAVALRNMKGARK